MTLGHTAYAEPKSSLQIKVDETISEAQKGNADAQAFLGVMYFIGPEMGETGIEKDLGKAATWFEKSAEQGNSKAQAYLGQMYLKGDGVAKDEAKGKELLCAAILQDLSLIHI